MLRLEQLLIFATFPFGVLAIITPITYQFKGLSFDEWASLFTLCFAPFIAHILAGVPTIVYDKLYPYFLLILGAKTLANLLISCI